MKKILTVLGMGLLTFSVWGGFTSCEGDTYYETGAQVWTTNDFLVEGRHWEWNSWTQRYEAVYEWDELDDYGYDYDLVVAQIYMNRNNGNGTTTEVLRALPYVFNTYVGTQEYTYILGYEIERGRPGLITFYIQAPENVNESVFLINYKFKISLSDLHWILRILNSINV